jgi:X-Pro dipeptidyl-peptidase
MHVVRLALLCGVLAVSSFFAATNAQAASGGATSAVLAAGTLSVTGAAPGTFSATLNGSDQTVFGTLATYQAVDSRGTGAGWNITFQATQFACANPTDAGCPVGGDTFATSSLLMAPPTVACHAGFTCSGKGAVPTISIAANTAIDAGSAVKVASAALNKGMGTYDFTPGTISTGNLQLTIPASAYATTYHSTLTVSAVSGP